MVKILTSWLIIIIIIHSIEVSSYRINDNSCVCWITQFILRLFIWCITTKWLDSFGWEVSKVVSWSSFMDFILLLHLNVQRNHLSGWSKHWFCFSDVYFNLFNAKVLVYVSLWRPQMQSHSHWSYKQLLDRYIF